MGLKPRVSSVTIAPNGVVQCTETKYFKAGGRTMRDPASMPLVEPDRCEALSDHGTPGRCPNPRRAFVVVADGPRTLALCSDHLADFLTGSVGPVPVW